MYSKSNLQAILPQKKSHLRELHNSDETPGKTVVQKHPSRLQSPLRLRNNTEKIESVYFLLLRQTVSQIAFLSESAAVPANSQNDSPDLKFQKIS